MRPTNVLLFLVLVLLVAAPAAAQTTQVQVIRYASDGTTVASQVTHDVAWMESNLPVFGDGATPYLFQGPMVDKASTDPAKWNTAEDSNLDKVNETIRGTYLKDLCDLVGGMQPGGEVKISASDGFSIRLAYDNVVTPLPRQGPPVLAWWTLREGYGYQNGIRLFFGADNSTNPYGLNVFGHEDMRQSMDSKYWGWYGGKDNLPSAAQLSNRNIAKVEIYPAPSTDWTVLLNGSIKRDVTKSYFEQGLGWEGHRASYTDANGEWEGMPLWRLVGYVDDSNEHGQVAFNRTLLDQGYTITVIAADGYSRTFSSAEVAFNSNYIVANTLDGAPLPAQINGKNVWPLRLVGVNATGGKSVGNITEIRLDGVPLTTTTPAPTATTTTPTTTPTTGIQPWTLKMSGYTDFTVTSDYFYEGMSCGGHTKSYTDANGVEWMGMPLWRLIGLVDDQKGHEVLIGAYNETLVDLGYNVTVIASDGFSKTFTSQEVRRPTQNEEIPEPTFLVACLMNGSALPEQVNGKNYWPLKLVGTNATGGKSVGNITEIRLTDLPIAPPAGDKPWTLKLTGYTNFSVTSDYFAQGIACGHSGSYTDANSVQWSGMPLWRLIGLVDDQVGHEDLTGAYNDTLADQGYSVTVIAGDGYSRTFTSQEIKRSANYLVASKMNGAPLPEQVDGKNYWPLKLVGANATGGKSVGNMVEIRLDNLPIAPPTTPEPTPVTGATVLFDGDLDLKDGTFACTAYNSGATHQIQNLTPNGALELAATAGNFAYNVTDKKMGTMGTMLLDGAGGYNLDSANNRAWAYRVNNVTKNDFSSTEGISVYRIADGDLVEFWYGTKGGAYEDALAVIRARVHVRDQATVFDGAVTLVNGTFGAYAYNSGATIPVDNLTVHGALEAASHAGSFTYRATDKKWSTMGTFLLDGVSTFDYNKTENTAWAYTLNGAVMNDYSADQGISAQSVRNGDNLVFYFGVKGAGLDAASAVVRVRVFVATDADFLLGLNGARNATIAKADFDASADRVEFTDVSGTWSGIPLKNLVGQVDDTAAGFNDVLATSDYTVRVTAVDGYNKTLNSSSLLGSDTDYIIADHLNGAPLAQTMWPLRLVGASVPPHLSVAKLAEISLEGLEEPPVVGGDTGFFLVSTTPSGAEISLEDLSGTRYAVGNTTAGPLNVSIALTGTPMKKIVANLTGYPDVVFDITQYPARGETIPVDLVFAGGDVTPTPTPTPETDGPFNGPHLPSTVIQAEHFDTGGEGVAYHDVEPRNLGNNNMRPGEGVDIETEAGVTNVAYIRAGEHLKYSVDTTIAGTFTLTLRAANPDPAAKAVTVYLDGVRVGQVSVGGTGGWTTYRDFAGATPLTITPGRHVVTLAFEGVTRLNLDWLSLSAGPAPTPTSATLLQTVPFGPGNTVPGRVQAENFDRSGADAAYSDATTANEGRAYRTSEPVDIEYTASEASYNVGWIRAGEWLVYTVQVTKDGQYTATLRAANPDPANKPVDVYVDGAKVGTAQVGPTGSFGTFKSFTLPVALTAGTHQVKLVFPAQRLNLNYVEFAPGAGGQPTVTTTTTQAPSGGASFTAAPNPVAKSSQIRFALVPAPGKTVRSAWWTFDKVGHYGTWNSRTTSPAFYYPRTGTYTPLVKITYTDGTTETVERVNYVTVR